MHHYRALTVAGALLLTGCGVTDLFASGDDAPTAPAPQPITLHCPATACPPPPACPDPFEGGLTGAQQMAYCPACPEAGQCPPREPCTIPEAPAGPLSPEAAGAYIGELRDALDACAAGR